RTCGVPIRTAASIRAPAVASITAGTHNRTRWLAPSIILSILRLEMELNTGGVIDIVLLSASPVVQLCGRERSDLFIQRPLRRATVCFIDSDERTSRDTSAARGGWRC